MQLNLQKHYFMELSGISSIKAHIEKINHEQIEQSKASGEIELNLSYTDVNSTECFKVFTFPYEMELDELKIQGIQLSQCNVAVVEGQGIDVECILQVEYELKKDLVVEVEPITESIEIEEEKLPHAEEKEEEKEAEIEKIKEDISKNYEDKLADSLATRKENKTITTKTHETESDFLTFFDEKVSPMYKLKCIYVGSEEDLDEIAKKYKVSMEKLLAGYDREHHKVVFKLDR